MASGSRSSSRWGSFLEKAVAGVESRLDTILAEDDTTGASAKSTPLVTEQPGKLSALSAPESARNSGELSRQGSTRANDRLQERLARVVGSRSGTPKPDEASRGTSPAVSPANIASPRSSLDSKNDLVSPKSKPVFTVSTPEPPDSATVKSVPQPTIVESTTTAEDSSQPRLSLESESKGDAVSADGISEEPEEEKEAGASADTIQLLRSDYEGAELRRQEEVHEYVERIDALQAKLQFLTKEATEAAQKAAEEAGPGTTEEKLAKKDEKIALLIEEGQKMSQNELKLMTTIKSIRAKAAENDKKMLQSKQSTEKAEKLKSTALEKVKAAEVAKKEESHRAKRLEKDMERLKVDVDSKALKISELQSQVSQAAASGASERLLEVQKSLDAERSTTSQIQEELSTLKIEKKLAEDRHRSHVQELEDNVAREKERARVADVELRGEIAALESRLETYRSQAEEITSGSGSDTQAKLFRQIETLQTQYSVASENWRGIESSLLARISALEKERNEAGSKEADVRKKMREASNKHRRIEEDLEQARNRGYELDEKLSKEASVSSSLRSTLEKAQAETETARNELSAAKEQVGSLQREMEKRERERESQALDLPYSHQSPISPGLASLKNPVDRMMSERTNSYGRRHGLKDLERPSPASRKASMPLGYSPFSSRNESHASMPLSISKESVPSGNHSPSQPTDQQDDLFDGVVTPATPDKTINDMFSASTAAAGPSVQLVERMSAAVRRLEAEKADSKEEIERVQGQRDEAREQVVSLMQEVDEKRKADDRVATLEAEVAILNQRYQTTLEMLGEKSERVEELQADIADMKQIYRDVLEKTVG
jgi:TATA element modulatory factor